MKDTGYNQDTFGIRYPSGYRDTWAYIYKPSSIPTRRAARIARQNFLYARALSPAPRPRHPDSQHVAAVVKSATRQAQRAARHAATPHPPDTKESLSRGGCPAGAARARGTNKPNEIFPTQ